MSDSSRQSASPAESGVTPQLASILGELACPACFGDLHLDGPRILCNGCGRVYPIVDGIPVLIVERGVKGHADGGKP